MKKFKTWRQSHFQKGSNRFVILLRNFVIKIPQHYHGIIANKIEYKNYLENKTICAETKKLGIFLVQERLNNIQIFKRDATEDEIPNYALSLFQKKINNRLQIGQDSKGNWKIFDFEDIKWYL